MNDLNITQQKVNQKEPIQRQSDPKKEKSNYPWFTFVEDDVIGGVGVDDGGVGVSAAAGHGSLARGGRGGRRPRRRRYLLVEVTVPGRRSVVRVRRHGSRILRNTLRN